MGLWKATFRHRTNNTQDQISIRNLFAIENLPFLHQNQNSFLGRLLYIAIPLSVTLPCMSLRTSH